MTQLTTLSTPPVGVAPVARTDQPADRPGVPVTTGTQLWRSWHLHVASEARTAQDRVVADVIRPVVDALPGHRWFFIRYWQGGPHLRLRIADLDAGAAARVDGELVRRLAGAGRLRSGEEPVDPATYLAGASRHAAAEHGADRVVSALRAPGVHHDEYHPEVERYGGSALLPVTEQSFHVSSQLAVDLLPRLGDERARVTAALRVTVAAAASLGDETVQAEYYRRSLEAWCAWATAVGFTTAQVEQLCHIDAAPSPAAVAGLVDRSTAEPFGQWHHGLTALAEQVHRTTPVPPGQVVFSHAHMLHNRLGRNILDELRVYAWLVRAFPGDRA